MPIMKSNYDVYGTCKQRKVSEGSSSSRSRKISQNSSSDCPSLSTSPNDIVSPSHRNLHHVMSVPTHRQAHQFSRGSSRNSQSSQSILSPTKSYSSSPPKPVQGGSQNSLNKFHNKLLDRLRKSFRRSCSSDDRS